MTSLRYNTFDDNNKDTIEQQCLICLQNSSNYNDEIKSVHEMHFLKKTCNCICYSHHKCIETWIVTNSVCPICKKPLLFPQSKLELKNNDNDTVVNIPLNDEEQNQNENENENSCRETASTYMCIIGLVFIILFLGNVITAIIYK